MKKALALLLLISISLYFLVGCNASDNYYDVKVTGSLDRLMEPIKPIYQAGTLVKIKARPITDALLHVFVNGEEIPVIYSGSGYWGYEFIMPEENITIHLTFDRFYGRDEYEFDELCWWIENLEYEITKVSIKTVNYAKKNSFIETKYSTNKEDINNFKAIVNQKLIKVDKQAASDAVAKNEYIFITYNDYQFGVLKFMDEFFIWADSSSLQAFKFKDPNYILPTIDNPDLVTYSFQYDDLSSDIKSYDDESFLRRYFTIDSVEFIPYDGPAIDFKPTFYIDSRYGKINLLTPRIFELDGEYYEIVSDIGGWAYTKLDMEGNI